MSCSALMKESVHSKGMVEAGLTVRSIAEANQLREALRSCHELAKEQAFINGGEAASVLVGKFPNIFSTQRTALSRVNKPCAFHLGDEGSDKCQGEFRLGLGLAVLDEERVLTVSAFHSNPEALQRTNGSFIKPTTVMVDIYSANVAVQIGCRNMLAKVDSLPRKAPNSWVLLSEDLVDEFLCVICIRSSSAARE
eukprot:CAMPEP_0170625630 /NCGR_PEP_ID=MMETSP0224-20130122/30866_1 /TAXON_ID=285029 /ORGANISM="Togula jolla, Strain CCCM 725" /LENGTH=194 /DNA_ID=CAMNT_0010952227 /DNA_START=122 /DNA_END=707 /DNA_ORIENTATION=-